MEPLRPPASHTTSHTHPHTHPPAAVAAVSLCEETGQVHYTSLDQDTHIPPHTYTSIPPQASKGRAGPHEEEEEKEMGGYSIVHYGNKPPVTSGTEGPQLYAQVNKKLNNKEKRPTGKLF